MYMYMYISNTSCHVYRVQVFHVELVVKATELMFSPPLSELEAVVQRLISTIVGAAQGLPRVWRTQPHMHVHVCHCSVCMCAGRARTLP